MMKVNVKSTFFRKWYTKWKDTYHLIIPLDEVAVFIIVVLFKFVKMEKNYVHRL